MVHTSGYFDTPDFSSGKESDLERLPSSNPNADFALWLGVVGDRKVVFKSLSSKNTGNPLFTNILRREYDIGRSLNHPGICETIAWQNREDIGPCIVMEYIDGYSLEEALESHLLNKTMMTSVLTELCDAVSYLHHKQVIHRDLKPSNIMITRTGGNVKVLDFGLADSDSNLSGKVPAGTRLYAAPEVLSGGRADIRSDIYSLGMIIRECRAGYGKVAAKCTKEDPGKRYSSVREVKEAILNKKSFMLPLLLGFVAVAVVIAGIIAYKNLSQKDAAADLFLEMVDLTREAATPSSQR